MSEASREAQQIVVKALTSSITFGIELEKYNQQWDNPDVQIISKKRLKAANDLYDYIAALETKVQQLSLLQGDGERSGLGLAAVPG